MDESRFDAWTRRKFGLGAGGLAASLLGVIGVGDAEGEGKGKKGRKNRGKGDAHDAGNHLHDAKHKNHKNKNKNKNKKKNKCKKIGTGCNPSNPRCCGGLHCQAVPGFGGQRCCNENNVPCSRDQECCSGLCFQGSCAVILS